MRDKLNEFASLEWMDSIVRWGKHILVKIDRWTSHHPGPAGFIVGVLLAASMFEW
ncbi:MAG: hypothetical protein SOX98_03010 [Acidaminococcus fermentans]|nr:hypothetical protein [Acidaminococcus fermentans]